MKPKEEIKYDCVCLDCWMTCILAKRPKQCPNEECRSKNLDIQEIR